MLNIYSFGARYGEEGGRLKEDAGFAWWRDVVEICGGMGLGVASGFKNNLQRLVGDGACTYFWIDN